MYCGKCGSFVPDGAAFCNNCGENLQMVAQAQMFQAQKNAIRQSEMDELERAIAHFNQKRAEFEEYDYVSNQVVHYARGARKSLIVWGAIIASIGLLMLAVAGSEAGVAPAAMIFLLPGIAMIAGGILMQVNNKKKLNEYSEQYARLSYELMNHYNAYPNCPVGAEYSNPEVLEIILGALRSGRADTIKESINVLISDAERAEMQEALSAIEAYTAQTSAGARAAAVFAAASFFRG